MSRKILSVVLLMAMVFLLVPAASAAPLQAEGEDYTIAVADWLSKLADKAWAEHEAGLSEELDPDKL